MCSSNSNCLSSITSSNLALLLSFIMVSLIFTSANFLEGYDIALVSI